jgi:5-methylcytosine-specific restriction endonuclease McrA
VTVWSLLAAGLVACSIAGLAQALPRSSAVKAEFRKANPCPATGKIRGACPGWEVDHRIALMCGGPDTVQNLQWLRVEEHRRKTAGERKRCRRAARNLIDV